MKKTKIIILDVLLNNIPIASFYYYVISFGHQNNTLSFSVIFGCKIPKTWELNGISLSEDDDHPDSFQQIMYYKINNDYIKLSDAVWLWTADAGAQK